jgi:ribosomal protein S18 acetylase RimI-like enzyme
MVGYVLAGKCGLPLPAEELKEGAEVPHGEVKRLYVHPAHFGCGIAEQLLRHAISWLRSGEGRQSRDIYLGVFSENPRAIRFYEKHNFKHCGEYEFVVGNQRDREFIMKNVGSEL